eukprot:2263764-Karenia_brevis.AAC.1
MGFKSLHATNMASLVRVATATSAEWRQAQLELETQRLDDNCLLPYVHGNGMFDSDECVDVLQHAVTGMFLPADARLGFRASVDACVMDQALHCKD